MSINRYAKKRDDNEPEHRTCPYCESFIVSNRRVKTCGGKACRQKYFLDRGSSVKRTCGFCAKEFIEPKSKQSKYCSYDCHIASGGAFRAGKAAAKSNARRGHRKDDNHDEIVAALEKLGVQVYDMSAVGGGFPDLLCCVRRENHFVEIKNPNTSYGRKGLNDLQRLFADNWRGAPVYIISTLEEVESFANYRLDEVPSYGGG